MPDLSIPCLDVRPNAPRVLAFERAQTRNVPVWTKHAAGSGG